jgi:hypothetical protein
MVEKYEFKIEDVEMTIILLGGNVESTKHRQTLKKNNKLNVAKPITCLDDLTQNMNLFIY